MSYDHRSYERNLSNCVHNCDDHSSLDNLWSYPRLSFGTIALSPVCQRHLLQLKEIEILFVC